MIFLTVGSELPFDRLVRAVDAWCATNNNDIVFGQIGDPGADGYRPRHFEWQEFISPDEYRCKYDEADLIIGHAGMGSIITALVRAKPILIIPRRAVFLETRNDHQVFTAQKFAEREGILVAEDETMIRPMLDKWETMRDSIVMKSVGPYAEERLIETIRDFVFKKGTQ
ncbi:MAG: glucuronosyltransferase [Deltaproteobacteria bacterium]|nr:glucuronosyltransferase [Deltaproteobacteria bacterium]